MNIVSTELDVVSFCYCRIEGIVTICDVIVLSHHGLERKPVVKFCKAPPVLFKLCVLLYILPASKMSVSCSADLLRRPKKGMRLLWPSVK